MNDLLIYKTKYRMRTNDFDCYDNIKLSSILDSTQDIAGLHAYNLGLGYEAMLNKNYFWVIIRQGFKLYKPINPGDELTVVTFPRKKQKLQFYRDYKIYNENNELLVEGTSLWVVIDTIKRRISKASDIDYIGQFVEDINDINLTKLDFVLNKYEEYQFRVNYSSLDHNKHFNNSKYLDMALDTFTSAEEIKVKEFYIDYIKEARFNELLTIKKDFSNNIYYFDFYNENNELITKLLIKVGIYE